MDDLPARKSKADMNFLRPQTAVTLVDVVQQKETHQTPLLELRLL